MSNVVDVRNPMGISNTLKLCHTRVGYVYDNQLGIYKGLILGIDQCFTIFAHDLKAFIYFASQELKRYYDFCEKK